MSESEKSTPPRLAIPIAQSTPTRWRWLTLIFLLPCVGAILGLMISVLSAFVAPKKYASVCVIQIHPSVLSVNPIGEEQEYMVGLHETEQFLQTEIAVIRSRETLMRVVERLDLTSRWLGMDAEAAVIVLEDIVQTEPVEGTDLVRIEARHIRAEDARDIADATARAYLERRSMLERERSGRALDALETEVRSQEDLVEEKRKLFHTILKAVGIPYIEGLAGSGVMGGTEETLFREAKREEAKAMAEQRTKEIQIKTLLSFDGEELLAYLLQSNKVPALTRLVKDQQAAKGKLKAMESRLGKDHPDLEELKLGVAEAENALILGVTAHRMTMQTDLNLLELKLEQLKEIAEERRFDAVDKALQSQDYIEARQDYEAAKAMLTKMKIENSGQRIALKIPRNLVTVHEQPVIARSPSSPSPSLSILMGILIGGGAGLLIALPISGLMIARG